MIREDLAIQQMQGAGHALGALVRHCRDVYVRAAAMLEVQSEELANMRNLGVVESIIVTPLLPAYQRLCTRYRGTLYDAQIALFPSDQKTPEQIWWAWFYHQLIPQLLSSAHFIRSVLRSMGLLNCPDPSIARIEVEAFLDNLSLQHSYFHPTWPAPL